MVRHSSRERKIGITVIILTLLATPARADNSFEQFLNKQASDNQQEQVISQEETNRQLIVLQKVMIDNLKDEMRQHRVKFEDMQAEIDALKEDVAYLKENESGSSFVEQQSQIDNLRAEHEQQKRDSLFNEMEARKRADEAEIKQEWELKRMKEDIENNTP